MASGKLYLADIDESTPPHAIKVVVHIESKKPPMNTGNKAVQSYKFIDEKGTRRRGVTFASNVDFLDRHFLQGKVYEIENVMVKPVEARYQLYPNELQLQLSRVTKIRQIDPVKNELTFTCPQIPLSRFVTMFNKAPFDVTAVVLHVDSPREVTIVSTGQTAALTDVFLTDDTTDDVILFSTWLVHSEKCQQLCGVHNPYTVVLLKCIKTVKYQEQSQLTSTYDTTIEIAPSGNRAACLQTWAISNEENLRETLSTFEEHRSTSQEIVDLPLTELMNAKAEDFTNASLVRVISNVASFDNDSPRTILSCRRCGHQCLGTPLTPQQCTFCVERSMCTAKMFIDFTASDEKASYQLHAQPRTVERLLKIPALDFHAMPNEDRALFVARALQNLKRKKVPLVLTPIASRLEFGKLQWDLKYI